MNYKINLIDCVKGHEQSNIFLNEYENPLLYKKDTDEFYTFHFNYDQIIGKLKIETVISFINQKMSSQAGKSPSKASEQSAMI